MVPRLLALLALASATTLVLPSLGLADGAPPAERNLVRTLAASGRFTILVNALVAADRDGALRTDGPFTLLAPTDEAFRTLPRGTLEHLLHPDNLGELCAVLDLHVLSGRVSLDSLHEAGKATSVDGTVQAVGRQGERSYISVARILQADIACANGTVHVLGTPLLPERGSAPGSITAENSAAGGALHPVVSAPASGTLGRWRAIHDTVMGGRSSGGVELDGDALVFAGRLSLENYGGFASVRIPLEDRAPAGVDEVRLRVRGDGRRYLLTLHDRDRADGTNFQAPFDTVDGEWVDVRLPLTSFRKTRMGQTLPGAAAPAPERLRSLGFLLADKKAGTFRLEIDSIHLHSPSMTDDAPAAAEDA